MTLQKAIERLEIMYDMREKRGYHSEQGALKLGIEAMKRIKAIRPYSNKDKSHYLPGETKE